MKMTVTDSAVGVVYFMFQLRSKLGKCGESLNHTCVSKIRCVGKEKGGFAGQIGRIVKYNHSVSQGLQDNSWHEDVLKISSLMNAHETSNLAAIFGNFQLKFQGRPSETIINRHVGRGLQILI
jgi:hypothetical protein